MRILYQAKAIIIQSCYRGITARRKFKYMKKMKASGQLKNLFYKYCCK